MPNPNDVALFADFLGKSVDLLPVDKSILCISRDSAAQDFDGKTIFVADFFKRRFRGNVKSFSLICSNVDSGVPPSDFQSTQFTPSKFVSDVDFFCLLHFLQFCPSINDALDEVKRAAAKDALIMLLVPGLDASELDRMSSQWLFSKDNFLDFFGDALLSVEKMGGSWLVLTRIPPQFGKSNVWNVNARQFVPAHVPFNHKFFTSNELDQMGILHATDKSSRVHDYLVKYDFFLSHFKHSSFTLMELGIFYGASLRMWKDFFPNAQIIGVDIDPNCAKYLADRIHIHIANLNDVNEVKQLREYNASVIIDDASHSWRDQILALSILFPHLPRGGVYIVEDLETSFEDLARRFPDADGFFNFNIDAVSFIECINRVIVSGLPIERISDDNPVKDLFLGEVDLSEVVNEIGLSASFVAMFRSAAVFVKR